MQFVGRERRGGTKSLLSGEPESMWQLGILQRGPKEDCLPDEVDQKAGPARLRPCFAQQRRPTALPGHADSPGRVEDSR